MTLKLGPVIENNVTGDGSWHKTNWAVSEADADWSLVSGTDITCQRSGMYILACGVYYITGTTSHAGSLVAVDVIRDMVTDPVIRAYHYNAQAIVGAANVVFPVDLEAGDIVNVFGRVDAGTKILDGTQSDTDFSYVMISRVK